MNSKHIFWVPIALLLLVLTFVQYSLALPIEVLNTQYKTFVSTTIGRDGQTETTTPESRTTISSTAINDYMYNIYSGDSGYSGYDERALSSEAQATASLFEVLAYTRSGLWQSQASAITHITFSPFLDSSTTLALDLAGWYRFYYSEGYVRLLDSTSNQELWNYGWYLGPGDFFWENTFNPCCELPSVTAALKIDTDFFAGHTYDLEMYTKTYADYDDERIWMTLSGLETAPVSVPEPSNWLLLASGLVGLGGVAWRRHRSS